MKNGYIITLSGISGAGKSYFIKNITERFDNFEKLVAVTTRQQRKGEIEGKDKFFLDLEEFNKKNYNGEMCTVNNVFGNMYGYFKDDIKKTNKGICLITELYYKEINHFKKEHPNTISVYILPDDIFKTIEELKARNTPKDEFEKRISDIKTELEFFQSPSNSSFDIIVTNKYDEQSLENFIEQLLLKIAELDNLQNQQLLVEHSDSDYSKIVDDFVRNSVQKDVVYTSFDGDDMHYLHNICSYEISRGNIPLNPETSLGYYISTVTLGGKKTEVMKDCLTLEMLANKMSVYYKENRPLSEGILAEMILWSLKKKQGLDMIEGVTHLSSSKLRSLSLDELNSYLNKIDSLMKYELFKNLLSDYENDNHNSAYIIANMENFKHIDWARTYCYKNGLCPISPQNILPLYLYDSKNKEYIQSRLELLRRSDKILLFIDRNNLEEDLKRLDPYSMAEIYFVKRYLKDKIIEFIGWDEALVPKYNQNNKWSLTTNEDIVIRKVLK